MSVYILVHKSKFEEAKETSKYVGDTLNQLFPDELHYYRNGLYITMSNDITIDFRYGNDSHRVAGIRPNYYFTDSTSTDVIKALQIASCSINGQRLEKLEHIIQIVSWHMLLERQIDNWLELTGGILNE